MKTETEIKEKLQELYDKFEDMDVSSLRGLCCAEQIDILNWVLDND